MCIQHVSKTYDVPKRPSAGLCGKSAGIDASYAASVSGSAVLAGAAVSQAAAEAADALRPAVRDGVVYALDDINIEIADGDIFGIIGMSGAGKSTLVRTINLLERPTSGRIVVDGRDVTDCRKRAACVSPPRRHDFPELWPACPEDSDR